MIWRIIARIISKPAVVNWLIRKALPRPFFHIMKDGKVYMERFWLFNPYPDTHKKWQFPVSIRLHHILLPDQDRHMHDHPWSARTIILRNWYEQQTVTGINRLNTGDTATFGHNTFHKITEVHPDGVWTVFITYKYLGTWGFLVDGSKIPYRKYLGLGE